MTEPRLKLSPPWITYVSEVNALFQNDPDVNVVYDNDNLEVKLYVEKPYKAMAIDALLPDEVEFGNITLCVTVIPANGDMPTVPEGTDNEALFNEAFDGNPVYAFCKVVTGMFAFNTTYVVFKNRVVQFFNDNLNDIYGNVSTLYQEIASDVFKDITGVNYCTDIEERVGMPLGEWP